MLIAPLYDRIFGVGMVSKHLKDDIVGHATGLITASDPKPEYAHVDQMVPQMLSEKPLEEIQGQWGEGIVELLWTKRALDFITRLLDYGIIRYLDKTFYECATLAYEEVLKPYHGFLVSGIVTLAFNLAPTRERFLEYEHLCVVATFFLRLLGFERLEDAQEKLRPFIAVIRPVLNHVDGVLDTHGCDFPDRV